MAHSVLISDFDGTITRNDFYALIADRYMSGDPYDAWRQYRAGEISHFDAMQSFFSHAPEDPLILNRLLNDVNPDPRLAQAAKQLKVNGWDLIIVSAGSSWYIDRILARFGIDAVVHANPGEIKPGQGLVLEAPSQSPFFCPDVGISKSAVVLDAMRRYAAVAFAGDGPPDVAPSLLVPKERRFARAYLAEELARRGEQYQTFTTWAEIVDHLTTETTPRANASI
jgi:2-hydroxy-3-keto-5-methylthiopentenyl-1-phosphate phosphatase